MDDLKVGLKLGLISLCVECVSITRTYVIRKWENGNAQPKINLELSPGK